MNFMKTTALAALVVGSLTVGAIAQDKTYTIGVSVPTVRRALSRVRRRVGLWSESDPFLREFACSGRRPAAPVLSLSNGVAP